MRYHYTPIRMAKIQSTDTKSCCGCVATGTLIHCWWECKNGMATLENSLIVSYKTKHTLTMWPSSYTSVFNICDPMDYSLPGSSVLGILQARILEWGAIPFSRRSSQLRDWTQVSWIAGGFFTVWATREVPTHWSCFTYFNILVTMFCDVIVFLH